MKFSTEMLISCPLHEVIKLFEDQKNNRLWQTSLVSQIQHEFYPTRSENLYEVNGRMVEVQIRIVENNLPKILKTVATMEGLVQVVNHQFYAMTGNQTKWVVESEFLAESLILKFGMFAVPKTFKKRTLSYMHDFKAFAEQMKLNVKLPNGVMVFN